MALLSLKGNEWTILYSKNMPAHPSDGKDGWFIELTGKREADYMVRPATEDVVKAKELVVTMRIEGDAQYKSTEGLDRGFITVMLRKKNDDQLTDPSGRAWCGGSRIPMIPGTYTAICPMTPSKWTGVFGKTPTKGEWAALLKNLGSVGVTYGDNFYGHGVRAKAGTGKIIMTQFEARA